MMSDIDLSARFKNNRCSKKHSPGFGVRISRAVRMMSAWTILAALPATGLAEGETPFVSEGAGRSDSVEIQTESLQVTVVKRPDTAHWNSYYSTNRSPLLPNPLVKVPLGQIRPAGWLKHQLDRMTNGMTGRLPELSEFLAADSSWLARDSSNGTEEAAYWLRGFHDLAVLTDDPRLMKEAHRWIEAVLASQQDNGYFGPAKLDTSTEFGAKFSGVFVHAIMLDAVIHHYEHTQDPHVVPFLLRFFEYCRDLPDERFLPPARTVDRRRPCEMIPHLHWLYNQTGETWLLGLATRFFKLFPHTTDPWPGRQQMLDAGVNDSWRRYRTDEWLAHHVVDFTHQYRYPGMYYPQSKARWHLDATEYWYNQHLGTWGQQPRGIFGADEVIRSTYTDPRQGCETCALVEFNKGFYLLGRITGEAEYADRCEDITLNHFPASQTPDLKGLHYVTASNQPQLDASEIHECANGGPLFSYSPHRYRCCQHNVAMGWPWYVQNLWQATADNGLGAWLYAACEVKAKVGPDGTEAVVVVQTEYPFHGQVHLDVAPDKATVFPLYLRVPRWCSRFTVKLNGKQLAMEAAPQHYVRIEHLWSGSDTIDIDMGMALSITRWPRTGSVTVDRGPLSFSVRIEEQWQRCGGTDAWPEWAVYPASPWNYGLVIDSEHPSASLEVIERDVTEQPWTVESAPIEVRTRARRIPNWILQNETVQELRLSPIRSDEPEETIRMIPLGCARLRMSCLPVIGDGPDARPW